MNLLTCRDFEHPSRGFIVHVFTYCNGHSLQVLRLVKKFNNKARDRMMVTHVRPNILVDMEPILSRKCDAVARSEYHKSINVNRNSEDTRYNCTQCKRSFKVDINFTLHVYWHTCLNAKEKAMKKGVDTGDLEAEDHSDEEDTNNVAFLKMKVEKGSADYDAVDKCVDKWIKKLNDLYIKRYPMTFRQALILVVNFDECGFQYKSMPQYSYVSRGKEIRAKKTCQSQNNLNYLEQQPVAINSNH